MSQIVPVILCGGSGTRLWPMSRPDAPKPFLPLLSEETLFQQAVNRCLADEKLGSPVIVAGGAHQHLIESQLPTGSDARIIIEPGQKNTAAAIGLAAALLPSDAIMLVCPSDHHISDADAFRAAAHRAAQLAAEGWLVAFGIKALYPETGYGYLKRGDPLGAGAAKIERFVEKPDLEKAKTFLAEGGYSWNGGLFAFTAGEFLKEMKEFRPAMHKCLQASMAAARNDGRVYYPEADEFSRIEGESVDYAIMENTNRAALVDADMGWSDIGNWQALSEHLVRDDKGVHARGSVDVIGAERVAVLAGDMRVSVVGVSDVIVVVSDGEVLICSPDHAQHVGKLPGAKGTPR